MQNYLKLPIWNPSFYHVLKLIFRNIIIHPLPWYIHYLACPVFNDMLRSKMTLTQYELGWRLVLVFDFGNLIWFGFRYWNFEFRIYPDKCMTQRTIMHNDLDAFS